MISEVDLGPWWRTTQNGVVGKSKVEESNMENFSPNLLDGDDTALEALTYSRHFPKRIEAQLQKDWLMVKSTLKEYGIACDLNLVKCSMTFFTTKTRDQDLIEKARDLLWLFSLAVPASQALKVLNGSHWDVIKLGYQRDGLCSKFGIQREQFLERRELLSHPSLKEIGDTLMCDFCMDGEIFVALGPIKSVKLAREVIEGSIVNNIHPASRLYIIKTTEMQIQERKRLEDFRL